MILLGSAMMFYVLRVLFNNDEFNWLTLVLSVSSVASVLTDSEIVPDQIVYYIIPLFYMIAMSVVYILFGEKK